VSPVAYAGGKRSLRAYIAVYIFRHTAIRLVHSYFYYTGALFDVAICQLFYADIHTYMHRLYIHSAIVDINFAPCRQLANLTRHHRCAILYSVPFARWSDYSVLLLPIESHAMVCDYRRLEYMYVPIRCPQNRSKHITYCIAVIG